MIRGLLLLLFFASHSRGNPMISIAIACYVLMALAVVVPVVATVRLVRYARRPVAR